MKEEKDRTLAEDSGRNANSYAPDPSVCEDKNVFTLDEMLGVFKGVEDENALNKMKLALIETAAGKGMSNDVILKIAKTEPNRKIKNGAMLIDIANREGGTIILGNGKTPDDDE